MKSIKFIAVFLLLIGFTNQIFAQETVNSNYQSVMGSNAKITGWYVGLTPGYTKFYNKYVVMPSLEGGIIIGRNLSLGLKGNSFTSYEEQMPIDASNAVEASYLVGGYGGFIFEPRLMPLSVFHLSFPCLVGAGGMSLVSQHKYFEWDDNEWDTGRRTLKTNSFFVLEPGVSLEINIARFMRISGGVTYRYTSGRNMLMVKQSHISGFSTNVSLKFGKF